MTFSTWACLRCLLELATIFGPQNRIQGRCDRDINKLFPPKIRTAVHKIVRECFLNKNPNDH